MLKPTTNKAEVPEDFDLCDAIEQRMRLIGFRETSVAQLTSDPQYRRAVGQPPDIQRVYLMPAFNNVLVRYCAKATNDADRVPPNELRIALTAAQDPVSWYTDVQGSVLPFLLVNEDKYFPAT